MTDSAIEAEAHDLIDLGIKMKPEGEGLDLTDRDYTLPDVIRLKNRLSEMRSTIDMVNAALAAYWDDKWSEDLTMGLDGYHYWLAPNRSWRIRPDASADFAKWVTEQDPDIVERLISPSGVRVSPLDKGTRDTFLTNEAKKADLRIQNKPR